MEKSNNVERRISHVTERQTLESRVEELFKSGMAPKDIARLLHTSLRYVHGTLTILGLID